ncbi:MAG: hydrogenase nickel incorporation protein HypB [Candidatus Dormibacteraeota bacterium]|nr:hydrogenase nickel incorporation protein HypB [Candidatus Dormibacteraeota bacterium]
MTVDRVTVVKNVLAGNERIAERNRGRVEAANVFCLNVISAPGAGKTSLIVKTLAALRGRARVGVIEGDIAGDIDTQKVLAGGAVDAVQINTGGECHLEASMVEGALEALELEGLDVLFVENVGNLVCPAEFALGERVKVCLSSAAEGDDKPVKYPEIFIAAQVVVLNKMDLAPLVDFDRERFLRSLRALNPTCPVFELSCRTGEGVDAWADWVVEQLAAVRAGGLVGANR